MKKFATSFLLSGLCLGSAEAALLAYESFDYPVNLADAVAEAHAV